MKDNLTLIKSLAGAEILILLGIGEKENIWMENFNKGLYIIKMEILSKNDYILD